MNGGDLSQLSLSDRFNSLVSKSAQVRTINRPTCSEPPSRRSVEVDNMRLARTRPPSPRLSTPQATPKSRSILDRAIKSLSISLPMNGDSSSQSKSHKRETSQPALPVLRWFTGKQATPPQLQSRIPTQSRPGTPLEYSDSPTSSSSHISALNDALCEDPRLAEAHATEVHLPSRPEAARLPPSLRPWRPPNHLSELSRTALPTACLSPTSTAPSAPAYQTPYTDPFADPFTQSEHNPDMDIFFSPTPTPLSFPHTPVPAHLNRSPPMLSSSSRTSLEALRSIQERSLHTTPPSQRLNLASFPNPFGWFSSEDDAQRKENMDPLLKDGDKAQDTESQKKNIQQKYASPKNPVVFCHGLLGFDTVTLGLSIAPLQVAHWRGIKDALELNGTEVLITRVPATSSPVDRAKVLEERINQAYPGRSVHLIGHSMGGLDCRYLTTHLTKRKFKVLSITTISTPHRGSSFADRFLDAVGLERLPSVLSFLDLLPIGGGDGKAFEFLTIDNMRRFNEDTPDVPGVKYYSWGAAYEPGLIDTWKWSHSVILEKEGPNDGLVSLESAKWGTYLGTLEGVNHLDLVGWVNTARYKWAEIMGREIKYKPATFYLGVADHIARVAEGQATGLVEESEHGDPRVSEEEREEIREEGERVEMAESLGKGESPRDDSRTPKP